MCTDKSDRPEITAEVPGRRSWLIVNAGDSGLLTHPILVELSL